MAKRYLWVVEWKDGKSWTPVDFESYRTRQQARQQCVRWREAEDAEFRVVRYSAEDTRG